MKRIESFSIDLLRLFLVAFHKHQEPAATTVSTATITVANVIIDINQTEGRQYKLKINYFSKFD